MDNQRCQFTNGSDNPLKKLAAGDRILPVRWVPQESSRTTTIERQLEKAAQRSHAARVSHQRRRNTSHLTFQPQYHAPLPQIPHGFRTSRRERRGSPSALRIDRFYSERGKIHSGNLSSTRSKRYLSKPHGFSSTQASKFVGSTHSSQPEVSVVRCWKGATDPFGTYPIAITPWVNHSIRFLRETWIPATYDSTRPTSVRLALAQREWWDAKHCLNFEAPAYAILTMSTVLMACHQPTPGVEQKVLLSKSKTLVSLRKLLTEYSTSASIPIIACVTYLLAAAVCANDLDEAEIHAKTLQRFFETRRALVSGSTEYTFFIRCLRFCIRHSTLNLKPPIFDLEVHVASLLRDSLGPGELYFATSCPRHFDTNLDDSLWEPLCDIVVRLRKGFWLWQQKQVHGITIEESADWVIGHYYVLQGRLLCLYDNYRNKLLTPLHSNSVRLRIEICLALGLLCILSSNDLVGASTQDSVGILLGALRLHVDSLMGKHLETQAESYSKEWQNPTLWFVFVAWFTDRGRQLPVSEDPTVTSFNERLLVHVNLMGLESWEQMLAVLRRFIFFDEMSSSGLCWFKKNILTSTEDRQRTLQS